MWCRTATLMHEVEAVVGERELGARARTAATSGARSRSTSSMPSEGSTPDIS